MATIPLRAYNREIENQIDGGRIDEAIAHCRHILQTFPKHIATYQLLGKAYLETQRYPEASDVLLRILSSTPGDFIAHLGMSIIREDEGNLEAAIWHMERAFEVQPANAAIQDELRRLYAARDGIEPAKVHLTRGALARMYIKGGLYPQAIAELRAALAEEPQRPDLQVLLARACVLAGQPVEAVETCGFLLNKLPFCLEANRILAEILPDTERADEAQAYLDRVAALDPYAAHASPASPDSEQVADSAVTIERLDWTAVRAEAGQFPQPDWATAAGLEREALNAEAEALPDWLAALSEQGAAQAASGSATVYPFKGEEQLEGESAGEPAAAPEELPEWMRESSMEAAPIDQEGPAAPFAIEEEEQSQFEEIERADIPDWLKAIAPDSAEGKLKQTGPLPWLEETPPEEGDSVSTWLSETKAEKGTGRLSLPDSESGAEIPDWLRDLTDEEPAGAGEREGVGAMVFEIPEQAPQDGEVSEAETPPETPAAAAAEVEGGMEAAEEPAGWMAESQAEIPEWMQGIDRQTGLEAEEHPEEDLAASQMEAEAGAWMEAEEAEPGDLEISPEMVEEILEEPAPPEGVEAEMMAWTTPEEGEAPMEEPAEAATEPQPEMEAGIEEPPPEVEAELAAWLAEESPEAAEEEAETPVEVEPEVAAWIGPEEAGAAEEEMETEEAAEGEAEAPAEVEPEVAAWMGSEEAGATEEEMETEEAAEEEAEAPAEVEAEVAAWIGPEEAESAQVEMEAQEAFDETFESLDWLEEYERGAEPQAGEEPIEVPDWLAAAMLEEDESATTAADLPDWLYASDEESPPAEAGAGIEDVTPQPPEPEEMEETPILGDTQPIRVTFAEQEVETETPEESGQAVPGWGAEFEQAELAAEAESFEQVEWPQSEDVLAEGEELEGPASEEEVAEELSFQAGQPAEADQEAEIPGWSPEPEAEERPEEAALPWFTPEAEAESQEQLTAPGLQLEEDLQVEGEAVADDFVPTEPLAEELAAEELSAEPAGVEEILLEEGEPQAVDEQVSELAEEEAEPLLPVPLELNSASLGELERLPGVGFIAAQNIVAYRQSHGPFNSLDDLYNVPDIDPDVVNQIAPLLKVERALEAEPVEEISRHPDVAEAWSVLVAGDLEAALDRYNRLVKAQQHLESVIRDLQEAAYLYPQDFPLQQALGDAYLRDDQLQNALDAYIKAEQLLM